MCYATVTEVKQNFADYLSRCLEEDVFITKNGRVVAVLSDPKDRAFQEFFAFQRTIVNKEPGKTYDEALYEEMMNR